MRIIRYRTQDGVFYGEPASDTVKRIEGDIFGAYRVTEVCDKLTDCELLPPCEPTKIVAVGKNYKDHALEMGGFFPKNPILFIKPTSAIIPHNGAIIYPETVNRVDYEGEFAIVIKKIAKSVKEKDAKDYILGYTCLNDVTAREIQTLDGQWTRAKGYDTFSPFGPVITDEVDPDHVNVKTLLNGVIVQNSNTSLLTWKAYYLVEFVTEAMTLYPGDIITTGTPAGIGPMKRGDRVDVILHGIGTLTNYVK